MFDTFKADGLICDRFVLGPFQVNTYLVFDPESKELLIIDPAMASNELDLHLKDLKASKSTIFLTHGHADHILGLDHARAVSSGKVLCSAEDAPMLTDPTLNLSQYMGTPMTTAPHDSLVKQGQTVLLGKHSAEVIAVPGHTPGGVALCFKGMIFTGDTLFAGSIGRSDFPGGDGHELISKIKERILSLSDRLVFPGHGPESSISVEAEDNPFLNNL